MNVINILFFLSLTIWIWILLFYRNSYLYKHIFSIDLSKIQEQNFPFLSILIPARNEEVVLPETLPSLLSQKYSPKEIFLIDDHSTDNTYSVAQGLHEKYGRDSLEIIQGKPLEEGWAGKMWALNQGLGKAQGEWVLLTDADLHYAQDLLPAIMAFAFEKKVVMLSLMARLRTKIFWEKLLIPAFLYFFKLMYPFGSVNNPDSKIAAAAGGCILIQKKVLEEIGGLEAIKDALIDDISLARKVKAKGYPILLLDSPDLVSKRGYDTLGGIWNMVTRSAFTELKYSYLRLMGCIFIMLTMFAVPFLAPAFSDISACLGLFVWIMMSLTYYPTTGYFALNPIFSFTLPLAGLLYLGMTIDSARRYLFGTKSQWKGRSYKKN